MPADAKLELLHSVPLFASLGRRELKRLGQLADEVDVPAGRVLMRQGERGAEMFVIVAGRVSIERDGRIIDESGPGAWVGEMALLSEGLRTATVTTTESTQLLVVGHRDFHALMAEMPQVKLALLECMADRIRHLESTRAH
jgi:CRP-like cAMP-binding protein